MTYTQSPSPNFNGRVAGKKIAHLILHYTDLADAETSRAWMCDPDKKVSAHYLVDLDGSVIQLVDESKRAWHAGQSFWQGETDLNATSIGIEIQNTGHSLGYVPFPEVQIAGVIDLCQGIIARHGILPRHVLAHSDIAPLRKIDPGHLFPWQQLAAAGIGLWPQGTGAPIAADAVIETLGQFGYDASLPPAALISAFQRHFEPEVFTGDGTEGVITPRTRTRLSGLVAQI